MANFDIVSLLPLLLVGAVLLIVLLVILNRILVNVGAQEIAIKIFGGGDVLGEQREVVHLTHWHEHGSRHLQSSRHTIRPRRPRKARCGGQMAAMQVLRDTTLVQWRRFKAAGYCA